jgi:hypothetical protein
LLLWPGCCGDARPAVPGKEQLLSDVCRLSCPVRQRSGRAKAARYSYAEPQHCVCIFVGTQQAYDRYLKFINQPLKPTDNPAPDYKTEAGVLLSNQPLRQSTRGDPTNLSDYLSTLRPQY